MGKRKPFAEFDSTVHEHRKVKCTYCRSLSADCYVEIGAPVTRQCERCRARGREPCMEPGADGGESFLFPAGFNRVWRAAVEGC